MKLCWDNIENIRLSRYGNFRDVIEKKTYHLKECKQCGIKFLTPNRSIKFCNKKCVYNNDERGEKIRKANIGRVVSDEMKEHLRKKAIEQWSIKENRDKHSDIAKETWIKYRDEIINARKNVYNDDFKKNVSSGLKRFYKNGGTNWNNGLTKDNDERLVSIGRKNSKNLKGRTKEEYEYLKKHSEYMKSLWKSKDSNMRYMTDGSFSDNEIEEWRQKISRTISEKISDGDFNIYNNFKTGYYRRLNGGKEFYRSSLELDFMKYFDNVDVDWTTKHGIIVDYKRSDNSTHKYIPDFLLKFNGFDVIIEAKGFPDDDLEEKECYIKRIYDNYHICYSLGELKTIMEAYFNETCKNKQDIKNTK